MPTPAYPLEGWEDEPTRPVPQLTRARVLLAEDDAELRAIVAARLRADGCEVLEARTGEEALHMMVAIAHHDSPEDDLALAIMDVRMPGMTGLEVVYLLRNWRWKTPVLLMTGYPERALIEEAKGLGVSVLAKPFGIRQLSRAAARVLGSDPRRQD